jgi:hypothetical protein
LIIWQWFELPRNCEKKIITAKQSKRLQVFDAPVAWYSVLDAKIRNQNLAVIAEEMSTAYFAHVMRFEFPNRLVHKERCTDATN